VSTSIDRLLIQLWPALVLTVFFAPARDHDRLTRVEKRVPHEQREGM